MGKIVATLAVLALLGASFASAQEQSTPTPKVKVGSTAPDFTLRDQTGKEISLHDFHGKKSVVLAFYIFAFTGG